ncbi:hypothetical protein BC03BB108_D0092 (plasmid) [Bacillus cereus 03BB108]|jgi:hypothetical protein|uniref:Membrane protein n=1 Tax=Bacillus cereus 03BB108 TaxID=451709 RepID=A0AAN0SSG9_BACCE|nr:putative membrane protein [Bacillus cereus 03BB108]EDX59580.1 hypothetical protein BC03BB108_D0092 [Bacillus cereus 03BB108]
MEEFLAFKKVAYVYALIIFIFVIISVVFMMNYDAIINYLK